MQFAADYGDNASGAQVELWLAYWSGPRHINGIRQVVAGAGVNVRAVPQDQWSSRLADYKRQRP